MERLKAGKGSRSLLGRPGLSASRSPCTFAREGADIVVDDIREKEMQGDGQEVRALGPQGHRCPR